MERPSAPCHDSATIMAEGENDRCDRRFVTMPQVAQLFFKTAVVFLIVGIAMGLHMSMSGNHDTIGAHAHTNLLGWVTSALFGGYYALNPAKAETRLAQIHFWVYTPGVAAMVPALYMFLKGYPAMEPLVALTSLVTFAGVMVFAVVVFRAPARQQVGATPSLG
jgi:peptidoglycan/LPS O-acetylase OafA/YrhL